MNKPTIISKYGRNSFLLSCLLAVILYSCDSSSPNTEVPLEPISIVASIETIDIGRLPIYPISFERKGALKYSEDVPMVASKRVKANQNKVVRVKPTRLTGPSLGQAYPINKSVHAAKRELLELKYPEPQEALAPVFKDNASYNIKYFDQEQGLNTSYVSALMEDKRGNIWLGSFNGGTSMYTGAAFYHFTKQNGMPSDYIMDIEEDLDGNIWFACEAGGIAVFDGQNLHKIIPEGIDEVIATDLAVTENGAMLVTTARNGVLIIENEQVVQLQIEFEGIVPYLVDGMIAKSGKIWLGSQGDGLFVIENDSWYHIEDLHSATLTNVWDIYEDEEGHVWLATDNEGIIIFDNSAFWQYSTNTGLPTNNYLSLFQDREGFMWLGSFGEGVTRVEKNYFVHFSEKEGLSLDYIWEMMEDAQGNILFGTDGGGLSRFENENFFNHTEETGLSSNFVFAIEELEDVLWFGSFDNGLTTYSDGYYEHYNKASGFFTDIILDLLRTDENKMWIASGVNGLAVASEEDFRIIQNVQLKGEGINTMCQDTEGNVWVGQRSGGIYRITDDVLLELQMPESMHPFEVSKIVEGDNGIIWISSINKGLIKIDGDSLIHFGASAGLKTNKILTLSYDQKDGLYIGTGGEGLFQLQDNELTAFTGLSNPYIWSIIKNRDGRLWVGSEKGMNVMEKEMIYILRKSDGFSSDGFYQNSAFLDSSNKLWFGGDKSLVEVLNDRPFYDRSKADHRVQIHRVDINGDYVDFRNAEDISKKGMAEFLNVPKELSLPYTSNHVTFHYGARNHHGSRKITYSYRVDGFNSKWSKPVIDTKVDLRNFEGGSYVFEVKALNVEGQWSEITSFPFEVASPPWRTPLAYMLYALVLTLALYFSVRWRFRSLHQNQFVLEDRVKKATNQLANSNKSLTRSNAELKDKTHLLEAAIQNLNATQSHLIQSEKMASLGTLSSGIAHEINNSLNFIKGGVFGLTQHFEDYPDQLDEDLNALIGSTNEGLDRATRIVKSLSYFNRSADGNKMDCNVNELLTDCLWMLYNRTKHRIVIINEIADEPMYVLAQSGKLYQALLNIISNAEEAIIKEGLITLSSEKTDEVILIIIQDNGVGISHKNLPKISDPFFTTKSSSHSTGLGLTVAYNIIKEYGGEITFESTVGEGTLVKISLPISSDDDLNQATVSHLEKYS
ncbi:MAG: signal transduction histidine kinase/ligand-binding sensor domain-containing protein [Cyclobacteriaceae bacterium]|jgi:signal transduction histidine kinase/ligand-binding sensor domain-containing protein